MSEHEPRLKSVCDPFCVRRILKSAPCRCFFQLRDEASLAAAQQRLAQAQQCFCRSHGPNLERIKVLHGDFCPELAT